MSDLVKISVRITEGVDGVPVVFIDTDTDFPENAYGPVMRIRLNDEPIHANPPLLSPEEQT